MLASGSWDGTVKLWDLNNRRPGAGITPVRTLERHFTVNSVAFSPAGKILASGGGDNVVKLWDVTTGKELHTGLGHRGEVSSVAVSPQGTTVASVSRLDMTIRLWDLASSRCLATLRRRTGVRSVAGAGRLAGVGDEEGVTIIKFDSLGASLSDEA